MRASETWCAARCRGCIPASSLPTVQVLNFYSTIFADQLKRGRKTATIRLGDKSHKYRKNQAVLVTIGYQHSPREKVFLAVIDSVEVTRVKELWRRVEQDGIEQCVGGPLPNVADDGLLVIAAGVVEVNLVRVGIDCCRGVLVVEADAVAHLGAHVHLGKRAAAA